jgi:hypothetical protein
MNSRFFTEGHTGGPPVFGTVAAMERSDMAEEKTTI